MSDDDGWVDLRYEGGPVDGLTRSLPAPLAIEGNELATPSPDRLLNNPPEGGKLLGLEYYGDTYRLEKRGDDWVAVYAGPRR